MKIRSTSAHLIHCALTAAALTFFPAATLADAPTPPFVPPAPPAAPSPATESTTPPARQPPIIRVYRTPAPTPSPGTETTANTPPDPTPTPSATPSTTSQPTTAIAVPTNTLGPGTPLWQQRELAAAQVREASANALIAEREAERSRFILDDERRGGVIVFGPHGRTFRYGVARPYSQHLRPARTGPVTVTVDRSNLSTAQRNFSDAATPTIAPIIEGQSAAQRRFGRIAAPPIAPIVNQIQDAQRAIHRKD